MRVFSILSGVAGLAFATLAVVRWEDPASALPVAVYVAVAALSVVAAFERLSHHWAFLFAGGLGLLWWLAPLPVDAAPLLPDHVGIGIAAGWTLLLALVAQRVSARRLREGA